MQSREKTIEDIDSGKIEEEDKEEAAAIKEIEDNCRDGSCEDKIARSHTLEYRVRDRGNISANFQSLKSHGHTCSHLCTL